LIVATDHQGGKNNLEIQLQENNYETVRIS
jgi:hypothetical protein